jgi:hypothetical protein
MVNNRPPPFSVSHCCCGTIFCQNSIQMPKTNSIEVAATRTAVVVAAVTLRRSSPSAARRQFPANVML